MEAVDTVEVTGPAPKETPQFANSTEAANFIERLLRSYVARPPSDIHLDSRKVERERDHNVLHVSDIIPDCLRLAYFRITDVAPDYADEVDAHWAHIGTLAEEWVRGVFRAEFPGRTRAQMAVPELGRVAGTLDIFWRDAMVVLDVKSRAVGWIPTTKEERQISTYAAGLSKKYGVPVHAVLVSVPRNDFSKIAAFPVEYEMNAVLESTSARAAYLEACRIAGTSPPIPDGYSADRAPCVFGGVDGAKYCKNFSQCYVGTGKTAPVPSSPRMVELMTAHRELAERAALLEKEAKTIKDEQIKPLLDEMTPFFQEFGDYVAAPDTWDKDLKRIAYAGRDSYNTKEAFAKIPALEAQLEPWKSTSAGYYLYRYVNKPKGKK